MAFGPSLTVGSTTYVELDRGIYMDDAATSDEPKTLEIASTVKPDGISSYNIRLRERKNDSLGGLDQELQVYLVIRGSTKVYNEAAILAKISHLDTFLTATGILKKILRGER